MLVQALMTEMIYAMQYQWFDMKERGDMNENNSSNNCLCDRIKQAVLMYLK